MKATNIMKGYKNGCDKKGAESSVPHHFQEKSLALGEDEAQMGISSSSWVISSNPFFNSDFTLHFMSIIVKGAVIHIF